MFLTQVLDAWRERNTQMYAGMGWGQTQEEGLEAGEEAQHIWKQASTYQSHQNQQMQSPYILELSEWLIKY